MRDPAKVYTKSGLAKYNAQLYALENAVDYFINEGDDLHLDERFMERLYEMQDYIFNHRNILEAGDGEDDEEADEEDAPPILI